MEWRGGNGVYSNNGAYNNGPYSNVPYNRNGRQNDPYYPNNAHSRGVYGNDPSQMVGVCQDEVRARAVQQYRVRNPRFATINIDNQPGARDRVIGLFEGNRGEQYEFACTVNSMNGRVRNVDIRRR